MFTIQDGRSKFYQWDKGRKLIVKDSTISEVHFSNGVVGCALVCETYTEDGKTFANVPNILLTSDLPVAVYAYSADYTKHSARFKVHSRPKPADYVYTETEIWTAEKAVAAALEEAKANGDFKGDKGDKGDPGAIEFIVVSELPAEGDGSAIYLLPSADGADQNAYDEFIFNAGEWEKIGSASVAVDLTDYVKKTDYASETVAGVAKTTYRYGITTDGNGFLSIYPATTAHIDGKSVKNPIAPNNLDYAVKVGVTTNTETLTDEEKAAACEWLGALPQYEHAPLQKEINIRYLYGVDAYTGEQKMYQSTNYNLAIQHSIPMRGHKGAIYIPDDACGDDVLNLPVGEIAVNKNYVDNNTVKKETVSAGAKLYGENQGGAYMYPLSNTADNFSVAQRGLDGVLAVATPTADNHATTKAYVDAAIAALKARIAALEAKAGTV